MKKARLRAFENRPMKTYKMTTNAIKWKIADEKEPDNTCQQITLPSKGNKENYDCSKDKKITLLKNMAEALDVSKRYYEQLKQKTNDQKQDKDKVNIGCASLVQYLKSKLQADVEHDWNASLE
jgi:type II secretory pathway component PulK